MSDIHKGLATRFARRRSPYSNEKPYVSAIELRTNCGLLLPASEGGTTNESLSRKRHQYDDDLYDEGMDSTEDWEDEDIDFGEDF